MNKKKLIYVTIVLTICFLLLGVISKKTAKVHKGIQGIGGAVVEGQFVPSLGSSGTIGGDKEKYKTLNELGTIFYILSCMTGMICIVTVVNNKKE